MFLTSGYAIFIIFFVLYFGTLKILQMSGKDYPPLIVAIAPTLVGLGCIAYEILKRG